MKRYIEQLIEDLQEAKSYAPKQKAASEMTENEFMEELYEIDRIIDEEEDKPMYNIFGIDPQIFPPHEKLTDEQATLLSSKIIDLWAEFNIDAVYPVNFPLAKLYPLLVEKFKEPFLYFPMGMTDIEFCNCEPDKCPFGEEYCDCKELAENWEKDFEEFEKTKNYKNKDELPF